MNPQTQNTAPLLFMKNSKTTLQTDFYQLLRLVPVVLAVTAGSCSLNAQVVSEDFSGYTTGGIAGQNVQATGLTGTWSGTTPGQSVNEVSLDNLSFGSLQNGGGSLHIKAESSTGNANPVSTAHLNLASNMSGTVYSALLVNIAARGSDANSFSQFAVADSGSTSVRLATTSDSYGSTFTSVAYAGTGATASTQTLELGTTYIVLSVYTNVGNEISTGNPGTITSYYLTEAQFTHYKALSFAGMDSASIGAGDSDVYSTISQSVAPSTPATYSIDSGNIIRFSLQEQGGDTTMEAYFDALRFGSSFDDVTPIPEPATLSWLGVVIIGCIALRRKQRGR